MISPSPSLREFTSIKESDPDPTGTGVLGRSSGIDFSKTAAARPLVLYKGRHGEFFLTVDVYAIPDQPMYLVIYCPLCRNTLRICQDHKAIELDLDAKASFKGYRSEEVMAGLGVSSMGPRLSVEPFRCSWEEKGDLRRDFGFSVCPWNVVIENNVARDL